MLNFFLFIFGAVVGSFLGMLTYRLPREIPLTGRSKCVKCKKAIKWRHNIPIIGYFLLGGKCANCKETYSARYPLIEIGTALGFVAAGFLAQNQLELGFFLVFTTLSLALFVIDLETKILPDILVLLLGATVIFNVFSSTQIFAHIVSGVSAFLFFLIIYLVTKKRGMGFGDVKLSAVLGTLLGYPGILVWLFLAFVSGALLGVVLITFKKAGLKTELPFGPFLIGAAWVTLFFGQDIISWYGRSF